MRAPIVFEPTTTQPLTSPLTPILVFMDQWGGNSSHTSEHSGLHLRDRDAGWGDFFDGPTACQGRRLGVLLNMFTAHAQVWRTSEVIYTPERRAASGVESNLLRERMLYALKSNTARTSLNTCAVAPASFLDTRITHRSVRVFCAVLALGRNNYRTF